MSRQMHQIDDDENAGKAAPWQRQKAREDKQSNRFFEQRAEESAESRKARAGSGAENQGMGLGNPFENWGLSSERKPKVEQAKPKAAGKGVMSVVWRTLSTVVSAGVIAASLFSLWMPANFLPGNLGQEMVDAVAVDEMVAQTEIAEGVLPENFPTNKIGIVVGHRGHDSGAVCSNGLTELEINSNVATYVQQKLIKAGYEVELLDEFDSRLKNYQAGMLLSIHADSCDYINDSATGFKVAGAFSQKNDQSSSRLVQCIADRYAKVTGLRYHYQSVTTDMTSYHVFDEINPYTTAGIIEIGFMNLDQEILTTKPELLAEGIVEGISCYMNNEEVQTP